MKKIAVLFLVLITFWSCDELAPDIPEPIIAGDRVVLIEEFSGGSCVPCSDAAILLEEQLAIHGHNLVVVTMHTLSLGQTLPAFGAAHDFRTEKGQSVIENLGLPLGIPSAVIDRKLYEGETGLQLRKDKWAGKINEQLVIEPKANLNLTVDFDESSRTLKVAATVIPAENISEEIKLTALITESHIIDKQATPNGIVDDWEHNHIMRDFITGINGESLGSNLASGVPVQKTYSFEVPPEDGLWIVENLEVVAYISEIAGDTKEIVQAAAIKILE